MLRAPDRKTTPDRIWPILRRTERRDNVPMRKLHESLKAHLDEIVALGEHHLETLVRLGRGYRNHAYLLAKLRFITANPIRNADGIKPFLALGLPTPLAKAA